VLAVENQLERRRHSARTSLRVAGSRHRQACHGHERSGRPSATVHGSMIRGRAVFGYTTFLVFSGSMPALREADYRSVLDVLREAGDVQGSIPFPEPVLEALRRLVPCDVVAYHEKLVGDAERTIVWTGEPLGEVTPEVHAAGIRYRHQDPMTPVHGARKYSDFLSRREFRRLELYQEACQSVGVEFMMRLWISPQGERQERLEFDRAESDFGERDRVVLDLLLPHLQQFSRNAAARRSRSNGAGAVDRLTPRERQILQRVARGQTNAEIAWQLEISPQTVRKHLENAYERLGVHTRTAAVAVLFELEPDTL
jgi:DNA-binding CsgD family transcriptional regulator